MSTITTFVLWFLVVTMVATTGLLFFCIGHYIWDCYKDRDRGDEIKNTRRNKGMGAKESGSLEERIRGTQPL